MNKDIKKILREVDLSPLRGKNVLITGATGLLGTYFVECIKELGGVNLYTVSYYPSELFGGTCHFCCDLAYVDIPWSTPFDYIIHAAGYGQPERFTATPIATIRLNTWALLNLFIHLKTYGRLLFLSSSEIYSGLSGSCKEDQVGTTNTDHPRSCYIEGKRCGEAIINAMQGRGVSARLALAYGPGTKPNDSRVMNEFIQRGIQEKEIVVHGAGEGVRTYCYISDAVEMLWNILLHGKRMIYNVGGGSRVTIGGLADLIGRKLGVPVSFSAFHQTSAPEEVNLDLSLYEGEFGGKEFTALFDGVERTIEYQQELYNNF